MNRREFSKSLLMTVAGYSLVNSLFVTNSFSKAITPLTGQWVNRLNEYCSDLKKNSITPVEWQLQIEDLYNKIELTDILNFIDFENLIKGFDFPDLGVNTKPVRFPKLDGIPDNVVFTKKIFGMKKDRAIIPHGHSNMASAHLVLKGDMHLRNYEKLGFDEKNMIILPTVDRIIKPGESSSISDDRDNVH